MTLLKLAIVGLSFACVRDAVSQSANQVQKKRPATSAIVRAEHDTVKAGAPIFLNATLTNQSDHELTFGYDRNRGIFEVDVFDDAGKFAPDKRKGYRNGRLDLEQLARTSTPEQVIKSGLLTGNAVWVTLKPGRALVETIDVSKYYEMTRPGGYKVLIQRPDPETKEMVKSNQIELTVTKP